jgi:hypothetical protein
MTDDKDIRFADKKVDNGWKESVLKDKSVSSKETVSPEASRKTETKTNRAFVNLLSSLGYQALMHLGDLPHPETNVVSVNLEAAREMIELLAAIREKTADRLSQEEARLLDQLIPELQMKFSQKV